METLHEQGPWIYKGGRDNRGNFQKSSNTMNIFVASKTLNFSNKCEETGNQIIHVLKEKQEVEMFVGTITNILPENNDKEEDQEEDNQANNIPEIAEGVDPLQHFMIPENIVPPDNIEDTINVLGLLNALHEHYQHQIRVANGDDSNNNENKNNNKDSINEDDDEEDNWDNNNPDDYNILIREQLKNWLAKQQDWHKQQEQNEDEDEETSDKENIINFTRFTYPKGNFEAMWEDDKNTGKGSCYIVPKSESILRKMNKKIGFKYQTCMLVVACVLEVVLNLMTKI